MRSAVWLIVLVSTLSLQACGFHLRTAEHLDPSYAWQLETHHLSDISMRALKRQRALQGLPLAGQAGFKVNLSAENFQLRQVLYARNGGRDEYEASLSLTVAIDTPEGKVIQAPRVMTEISTYLRAEERLGRDQDLQNLRTQMTENLIQRILQRLDYLMREHPQGSKA
ncbi:Outer membrane lipoprotein LptE/RlpB (LPS assembly) [Allopseudospirillum japonicum]|uniref:Outer membrane lipoprotein LptE/RlpB (LPS assembly) n=1 Tax=Allopseudospirillum japonicum TaxID=64971 RepID=A0A1H6QBR9_9GAMM|nr:hypothetical protein [Allopseudospirillum japonicum]SEI41198.1 Outer membrane lipoprotein LptE/RlpB (LPS assembly) [Allopseudospirillum japonicum]